MTTREDPKFFILSSSSSFFGFLSSPSPHRWKGSKEGQNRQERLDWTAEKRGERGRGG